MIKCAVVDDELAVAASLERCLIQEGKYCGQELQIEVFGSGEEVIRELSGKSRYHMIFLDIEMGKCSGIDVSRYLRDTLQDETTQIVYVSGKNGYDRQLFEFRPFRFLEKPVDPWKVKELLEKYLRVYGGHQDYFEYKIGSETHVERLNEILYFESIKRKIRVKTIQGEEEFYGSLQKVAEQMESKGFFLPHKSFLVNYRLVKTFGSDGLMLVNGEQIPVAKGKRKEIAKALLFMENGGGANE